MSNGSTGGGSLSQISGTIAGVGGGALLLPRTGSSFVTVLIVAALATGLAMITSMLVSKLARRLAS